MTEADTQALEILWAHAQLEPEKSWVIGEIMTAYVEWMKGTIDGQSSRVDEETRQGTLHD